MSERFSALESMTDEQFVNHLKSHGFEATEREQGTLGMPKPAWPLASEGVQLVGGTAEYVSSESTDSLNYAPDNVPAVHPPIGESSAK